MAPPDMGAAPTLVEAAVHLPAGVAFARVIWRGMLLAAMALVMAAALSTTTEPDRPVATVGRAGVDEAATTTSSAPAPTTTTTARPKVATTSRSTTVVRNGGVTVVNEGSASVNTGGDVVIGPPSATVVNGPATAVGNVSRP